MTELQDRLLTLLKEIDTLCRDNGIEFYLAAGTALGAVRHKGFIPWDDDADICMTKSNWEKFAKLKYKLPANRELVSMDFDYNCGYTINRYVDSSSMRLYRYHCASPQPAGILIDILVLDPLPNSQEAVDHYNKHLTEYCDMLVTATVHAHRSPFETSYMKYWFLSKIIGRNKTLDYMRKKTFCYDENEDTYYYAQRDGVVPHVWKKSVYGKPKYVPFEDTYMPIAECYYEHLSEAFDEEWMYVPEMINREEHIKTLDFNISYNNAMNDFARLVDRSTLDPMYQKRQRLGNLNGSLIKKQVRKSLQLSEAMTQLKYEKNPVDSGELLQHLNDSDHEFLDEYFKEYEELQTSKNCIGGCAVKDWLRSRVPYYVDIDDQFLYVFLRNYMHKGHISKAKRIMQARENKRELSDGLKEIKELIYNIIECGSLMSKGEYATCNEIAHNILRSYPENLYGKRLYYSSLFFLGPSSSYPSLQKELEEIADNDDVLLAVLSEIYWKGNRYQDAFSLYRKIADISNHGLVLFHIKERLETMDEEIKAVIDPTEYEELLLYVQSCLGDEEARQYFDDEEDPSSDNDEDNN